MEQTTIRLRVGFAGSRAGMTPPQARTVEAAIAELRLGHELEAHHGDSQGADAQFHGICRRLGVRVVLHPPDERVDRAFCLGAAVEKHPRGRAERGRLMVNLVQMLVAAPTGDTEQTRGSGTWRAVRHARRLGRPVVFFLPCGSAKIDVEA